MKFQNHHLAITKPEYEQRSYDLNPDLSIQPIVPTVPIFSQLLEKVGGPWDWTRRPKYYSHLSKNMALQGAAIHLLKVSDEPVGYCLSKRRRSCDLLGGQVIEIENFGLFPEHNGKGYGKTFLPLMFSELFEKADAVYLTTRSTNHPKVLKFYQELGMTLIKSEECDDDLIQERTRDREKTPEVRAEWWRKADPVMKVERALIDFSKIRDREKPAVLKPYKRPNRDYDRER